MDYVSVKAVFVDEEQARAELARNKELNPSSTYILLKTRLFNSDAATEKKSPQRVQGFEFGAGFTEVAPMLVSALRHWRNLLVHSSDSVVAARSRPIMGLLAEYAMAKSLNAELLSAVGPADLRLKDGTLVDVKTLLLDHDGKRSPFIEIRRIDDVKFLGIVVFGPDLELYDAVLIPISSVEMFARPGLRKSGSMRLRVTPAILNHPEAKKLRESVGTELGLTSKRLTKGMP